MCQVFVFNLDNWFAVVQLNLKFIDIFVLFVLSRKTLVGHYLWDW